MVARRINAHTVNAIYLPKGKAYEESLETQDIYGGRLISAAKDTYIFLIFYSLNT